MSFVPELDKVVCLLNPLADKYFQLGIQLGIKIEQLKDIESKKYDVSRCLIETINLWQNNTTSECTWSALADAVERTGGHKKLTKDLKARDTQFRRLSLQQACAENVKDTGYSSKEAGDIQFRLSQQHACAGLENANDTRYSSRTDREAGDMQFRLSQLQHTYAENASDTGYSSRSDSISGDSSGSEAEYFEVVPGCGCSKDKRCSLNTFYTGGCPNPTSRIDASAVVKRKLKAAACSQREFPYEEEMNFEDYEKRTKYIQRSFGAFALETCRHFKTGNVSIKEINLYLQAAYPVMKPRMEELSKATSLDDVFRIIVDQACSWFDHEIIKDLIHRFRVDSAKSYLEDYEMHFKKYAEQQLPKGMKHIEIGNGAKKGGKQLVIKVDREWGEVTFSDLDKLRGTFASILGVRRNDLYLADVREGCILMTFMITEELAERVFPSRSCLTSNQVESLRDEGVVTLRCGRSIWRSSTYQNVPLARQRRRSLIFNSCIVNNFLLLLALACLVIFCGCLGACLTQVSLENGNYNSTRELDIALTGQHWHNRWPIVTHLTSHFTNYETIQYNDPERVSACPMSISHSFLTWKIILRDKNWKDRVSVLANDSEQAISFTQMTYLLQSYSGMCLTQLTPDNPESDGCKGIADGIGGPGGQQWHNVSFPSIVWYVPHTYYTQEELTYSGGGSPLHITNSNIEIKLIRLPSCGKTILNGNFWHIDKLQLSKGHSPVICFKCNHSFHTFSVCCYTDRPYSGKVTHPLLTTALRNDISNCDHYLQIKDELKSERYNIIGYHYLCEWSFRWQNLRRDNHGNPAISIETIQACKDLKLQLINDGYLLDNYDPLNSVPKQISERHNITGYDYLCGWSLRWQNLRRDNGGNPVSSTETIQSYNEKLLPFNDGHLYDFDEDTNIKCKLLDLKNMSGYYNFQYGWSLNFSRDNGGNPVKGMISFMKVCNINIFLRDKGSALKHYFDPNVKVNIIPKWDAKNHDLVSINNPVLQNTCNNYRHPNVKVNILPKWKAKNHEQLVYKFGDIILHWNGQSNVFIPCADMNHDLVSTSEIGKFDEIPGCGCDNPCSIYTLCAGRCPNPTNKKVRVLIVRELRARDVCLTGVIRFLSMYMLPCAAPKLSEIIHTLKQLEDNYYELGLQLDVGSMQLKEIERQYIGNSRRFIEVIKSWQKISANCIWSALADGVKKVGCYNNLVKELIIVAHDNYCNHHPQCIPMLIRFIGPLATQIFQKLDRAFQEALSACDTASIMSASIKKMNVMVHYKCISLVHRAKCETHCKGQQDKALLDYKQAIKLASNLECDSRNASLLCWSERFRAALECVDRAKEQLAGLAAPSSDTAVLLYEEVLMKFFTAKYYDESKVKFSISQVENDYIKMFNHSLYLDDSQLCTYVNALAEVICGHNYDNLPFFAAISNSDLHRAEEILDSYPLRDELPTKPHGNRGWYYRNRGDLCMWRKQYFSKAIEWAKKTQDQVTQENMKHVNYPEMPHIEIQPAENSKTF